MTNDIFNVRRILFFLIGFAGIGGQVLILRRMFVSFTGNELTIGVFLCAWTFWTALGSWIGGRLAYRTKNKERLVVVLFEFYLITFAITFIEAYLLKPIIGTAVWEEVGIIKMLQSAFFMLAPLCLLLGALFPSAAQISPQGAGGAVSETYSWEAFGAGTGGITANLLVIVLKPMEAVSAMCAPTLLLLTLFSRGGKRIFPFLLTGVSVAGIFSSALDDYLVDKLWSGYPVKVVKDSRYSNLVLTVREGESALFSDGAPIITLPGGVQAEEIAHIPMLLHAIPQRVLLIGGSLLTTGKELLKYPIERLDYCQLDPAIVAMEKKICDESPPFCNTPKGDKIFESSNVRIHLTDGRAFLREAPSSYYDVIIFDVGAPATLALNRYITVETFALAKKALAEGGLICFGSGEYANYIDPTQARLLALIKNTVESVFKNVTVLPLGRFYFVAGNNALVEADADTFDQALVKRNIPTSWFKRETYRANLTAERIASIHEAIKRNKVDAVNEDYKPLGFIYWTSYWATLFSAREGNAAEIIVTASGRWVSFGLLLFGGIGIVTAWFYRKGNIEKIGIFWAMMGIGFAEMTMSVAVLYAAQLRLGTLFFLLGFLVSALMWGMGVGGVVGRSIKWEKENVMLILSLVLLALSCALVGWYLPMVLQKVSDAGAIVSLNCAALVLSFAGGLAYASSAKAGEKNENCSAKLGGWINSADLLGTACGAVAAGTVMIPLWGFSSACLTACAVLIIASLVLVASFVRNWI